MGIQGNSIVLIGGGGHCVSVLDSLNKLELFLDVYITDQEIEPDTDILGHKVVGDDSCLYRLYENGVKNAFITVGCVSASSRKKRNNIFNRIEAIGFSFPIIADSTSVISNSASINKGVFIGKNAVVNAESVIREFAIINTSAVVEHRCHIGCFAHIAIGAVVCGDCNVGDNTLIGAGATIIQGVTIGSNCTIGAGSVVLKDVPDNHNVYGVWKGLYDEKG